MISVLLVEDQNIIRQLLKNYLEQESDLEIVGVADNGEEAVNKIEQLQPEVVIMDIEMPKVDGLSATKIISQRFPQTKVVILSTHDGDRYLSAALKAGAKGYLLKNTPPQELVNTIRAINQGYFQLGPGLLKKVTPVLSVVKSSNQFLSIPKSETSPIQRIHQIEKTPLLNYLGLGVLLNMVIWTLALAYLKFSIPTYTSEWGIKILETDPGVEIVSPNEGKETSVPSDWSLLSKQDPRNDYVYIATSSKVLEKAANLMGITVENFDKPEITVDDKNGILDFSIVGKTPEEAQQKAMNFYQVMTKQIEALRTREIQRQEQKTQATLESAREKLNIARQKLSEYQSISGIDSNEQTKDITAKIATLRQKQAELLAQLKDITANRAELQQLVTQNKDLETQITQLEDRLQPLSQKQLELYSLERDLQVAETIFAATLAKLDLGQDNIYSIYPPIQLVTEPTRPEKPTSPCLSLALLGGVAGSFLVNTGLVLLWFNQQKFRFHRSVTQEQV